MQPKLLKTDHAEYVEGKFSGKNESGFVPIGDRVLVMPDAAAQKTSGGIDLPDSVIEKQAFASQTGVVVEMGEGAFKWNADRARVFEGKKPEVGSRVFFDRYAGGDIHRGRDGKMYRIMDDKCIGGFVK